MAKTTIKASQAADLMRAGSALRQMHTRHGIKFFLIPGGEVSDKVAAELIERPDVQPDADGLFPDTAQTFRLGRA
jgi:hypothetical protein